MKFKDKHAKILIILGIIFFLTVSIIFFWKELNGLSTSRPVNDNKLSSYGTLLSGLVGTCWSLASVILFYVALTEQRKDMEVNRAALSLQTDALTQQIKEFELQTKELEATRKVYTEQSATQQMQRFENTFFQMLTLHHSLVDAIALRNGKNKVVANGRDSFKTIHDWFKEVWDVDEGKDPVDTYLALFNVAQESLGHYFRNLYHIIKFIDRSEVANKKFYASLVRSQLSSYELLLLVYNCLSDLGSLKFKPLVEKYSLLKNIDWQSITGVDVIKQYKPQAFGRKNFDFVLDKPNIPLGDINL